jgi:hypothetical protein
MAFDPVLARDVVLPLATTAYAVMDSGSATPTSKSGPRSPSIAAAY